VLLDDVGEHGRTDRSDAETLTLSPKGSEVVENVDSPVDASRERRRSREEQRGADQHESDAPADRGHEPMRDPDEQAGRGEVHGNRTSDEQNHGGKDTRRPCDAARVLTFGPSWTPRESRTGPIPNITPGTRSG
jgi:hypothetical protein